MTLSKKVSEKIFVKTRELRGKKILFENSELRIRYGLFPKFNQFTVKI